MGLPIPHNLSSTMKVLVLLLSVTASALSEQPLLHYHESAGIAAAARIQRAERAADFDGSRIVGGSAASAGAYPHLGGLVILLSIGVYSVCGSSLLTNTRSVTAAHCWWDGTHRGTRLELVHGSTRLFSGGVRTASSAVELHAGYRPSNLNNDIAIISHDFVGYTDVIRNIALPSGQQLNDNFAGSWAQAAGFGKIADNIEISVEQWVSHASLQVITNAVCTQFFGGVVVASTLCTSSAGGVGTCAGDSGGPLAVAGPTLIGVSSFVSGRGCQVGWPSAFARVTAFHQWIRDRI